MEKYGYDQTGKIYNSQVFDYLTSQHSRRWYIFGNYVIEHHIDDHNGNQEHIVNS